MNVADPVTLMLSDQNSTISAHAGEIILLTGDSGSGKSCWLQRIAGLTEPPAGCEIILSTQPTHKSIVRMIPDRWPTLWLGQSVEEELTLGLARAPERARLHQILSAWRLESITSETTTASLNRLQSLRLSLAAASLAKPDLLLLDNPTAALNQSDAAAIIHDIKSEPQLCNAIIVVACNRWHDWRTSAAQIWQTSRANALPNPRRGDIND